MWDIGKEILRKKKNKKKKKKKKKIKTHSTFTSQPLDLSFHYNLTTAESCVMGNLFPAILHISLIPGLS